MLTCIQNEGSPHDPVARAMPTYEEGSHHGHQQCRHTHPLLTQLLTITQYGRRQTHSKLSHSVLRWFHHCVVGTSFKILSNYVLGLLLIEAYWTSSQHKGVHSNSHSVFLLALKTVSVFFTVFISVISHLGCDSCYFFFSHVHTVIIDLFGHTYPILTRKFPC